MIRDRGEMPVMPVTEGVAARVCEAMGVRSGRGFYQLEGQYSFPEEWNKEGGWLVVGEGKDKPALGVTYETGSAKWQIRLTGSEKQSNDAKLIVQNEGRMLGRTVHLQNNETTLVMVALPTRYEEEPVVWMDQEGAHEEYEKANERLKRMVGEHPDLEGRPLLVMKLEQPRPGQVEVRGVGTGYLDLVHYIVQEEEMRANPGQKELVKIPQERYGVMEDLWGKGLSVAGMGVHQEEPEPEVIKVEPEKLTWEQRYQRLLAKRKEEEERWWREEEPKTTEPVRVEERPKRPERTLAEWQREIEEEFGVKVSRDPESGIFSIDGEHEKLVSLLKRGMVTKGKFPYYGFTIPRKQEFDNYIVRRHGGEPVVNLRKTRWDAENNLFAVEVKPVESKELAEQFMREFMRNAVVSERQKS